MIRSTVLALVLAVTAGSSAQADWRDDLKVLRVGTIAPRGAAYQIAHLEPFRAYLERRLGLPVEIVTTSGYDALIDAQVSARVQYAIHSATSYATAAALCQCVEPIAVPAAADGSPGFHSVLVARADSEIQSIAGAEGKRLVLSGPDSIAGRLVPLEALARESMDPQKYFSTVLTASDPQDAVTRLFTDEADVAAAWSSLAGEAATGYSFGVFTRMVASGALSMERLHIIWQSPLIPFGPHVLRRDMPEELRSLIVDALAGMAEEAPDALDAVDGSSIGGGGFVPIADKDFAVIEELIASKAGGG
jgi:phosphonate transport system substrate-binding protein